MVSRKMKDLLLSKDQKFESVQEDKLVEEKIVERNIKLRAEEIIKNAELEKKI